MQVRHLAKMKRLNRKERFLRVLENAYDAFDIEVMREFVYNHKCNSLGKYFIMSGYKDLDKVRRSFTGGEMYV